MKQRANQGATLPGLISYWIALIAPFYVSKKDVPLLLYISTSISISISIVRYVTL